MGASNSKDEFDSNEGLNQHQPPIKQQHQQPTHNPSHVPSQSQPTNEAHAQFDPQRMLQQYQQRLEMSQNQQHSQVSAHQHAQQFHPSNQQQQVDPAHSFSSIPSHALYDDGDVHQQPQPYYSSPYSQPTLHQPSPLQPSLSNHSSSSPPPLTHSFPSDAPPASSLSHSPGGSSSLPLPSIGLPTAPPTTSTLPPPTAHVDGTIEYLTGLIRQAESTGQSCHDVALLRYQLSVIVNESRRVELAQQQSSQQQMESQYQQEHRQEHEEEIRDADEIMRQAQLQSDAQFQSHLQFDDPIDPLSKHPLDRQQSSQSTFSTSDWLQPLGDDLIQPSFASSATLASTSASSDGPLGYLDFLASPEPDEPIVKKLRSHRDDPLPLERDVSASLNEPLISAQPVIDFRSSFPSFDPSHPPYHNTASMELSQSMNDPWQPRNLAGDLLDDADADADDEDSSPRDDAPSLTPHTTTASTTSQREENNQLFYELLRELEHSFRSGLFSAEAVRHLIIRTTFSFDDDQHDELIESFNRMDLSACKTVNAECTHDPSLGVPCCLPRAHALRQTLTRGEARCLRAKLFSLYSPPEPVTDDVDCVARLRITLMDLHSTARRQKRKKNDDTDVKEHPQLDDESSKDASTALTTLSNLTGIPRDTPLYLPIVWVNRAYERLTRYTQADMVIWLRDLSHGRRTVVFGQLRPDHVRAAHVITARWAVQGITDAHMYQVRITKDRREVYMLSHFRMETDRGLFRSVVESLLPLPDDPTHPPPPFVEGVDLDVDTLLYGYKPNRTPSNQQQETKIN